MNVNNAIMEHLTRGWQGRLSKAGKNGYKNSYFYVMPELAESEFESKQLYFSLLIWRRLIRYL